MKRNNYLVYILAVCLLLCSCRKNTDEILNAYIERKCDFNGIDTCYIDLKDALRVDYDTMYVFGEYTQLQGIRLIVGIENYNNENFLLPKGFVVEDSHRKIILIKDRKIVYDNDFKYPYFDDGVIVKKNGTFDGELYTHTAIMYVSSKFLVVRKEDSQNQITKHFYILRNMLYDGSILPIDTTNQE